jgi:transcription antitermination factor NusG
LRHNDLVEVTAGPLMHHRGRIVELGKNRVKAVLSSLGYNMVANVAADEVVMVPAI